MKGKFAAGVIVAACQHNGVDSFRFAGADELFARDRVSAAKSQKKKRARQLLRTHSDGAVFEIGHHCANHIIFKIAKTFHQSGKCQVSVPMLHFRIGDDLIERERMVARELPYKAQDDFERFVLVFVVADERIGDSDSTGIDKRIAFRVHIRAEPVS